MEGRRGIPGKRLAISLRPWGEQNEPIEGSGLACRLDFSLQVARSQFRRLGAD